MEKGKRQRAHVFPIAPPCAPDSRTPPYVWHTIRSFFCSRACFLRESAAALFNHPSLSTAICRRIKRRARGNRRLGLSWKSFPVSFSHDAPTPYASHYSRCRLYFLVGNSVPRRMVNWISGTHRKETDGERKTQRSLDFYGVSNY